MSLVRVYFFFLLSPHSHLRIQKPIERTHETNTKKRDRNHKNNSNSFCMVNFGIFTECHAKKRWKQHKTNKLSNYLCAEMTCARSLAWAQVSDRAIVCIETEIKRKKEKTVLFVGVCVWQCDSVKFQFVPSVRKQWDKVPFGNEEVKQLNKKTPNTTYFILIFNRDLSRSGNTVIFTNVCSLSFYALWFGRYSQYSGILCTCEIPFDT